MENSLKAFMYTSVTSNIFKKSPNKTQTDTYTTKADTYKQEKHIVNIDK